MSATPAKKTNWLSSSHDRRHLRNGWKVVLVSVLLLDMWQCRHLLHAGWTWNPSLVLQQQKKQKQQQKVRIGERVFRVPKTVWQKLHRREKVQELVEEGIDNKNLENEKLKQQQVHQKDGKSEHVWIKLSPKQQGRSRHEEVNIMSTTTTSKIPQSYDNKEVVLPSKKVLQVLQEKEVCSAAVGKENGTNADMNQCTRATSKTRGNRKIICWFSLVTAFCCIVEMLRRAYRAKQDAHETAALRVFQAQVTKIGTMVRNRTSVISLNFGGSTNMGLERHFEKELSSRTLKLRIWFPAVTVLVFWTFLLIPWKDCLAQSNDNNDCSPIEDTALLSVLFSHITQKATLSILQRTFVKKIISKVASPRTLWHVIRRPRRFYRVLQTILRWIRYIRFAGPLLHILDKVRARLRDLYLTHRQQATAAAIKEERIRRRTLLQNDISRVASVEKKQRGIRAVQSQLFRRVPEQYQALLQNTVGDKLATEKKILKERQRKVQFLNDWTSEHKSKSHFGDVYDELVDLSQEEDALISAAVTTTTSTNGTIGSNDPFLPSATASKSKNLLPPNTRFNVGWRVVVTLSLLMELLRMFASWRLTGNYSVSLHDLFDCSTYDSDHDPPTGRLRWLMFWRRHQHHPDAAAQNPFMSSMCSNMSVFSKQRVLVLQYAASFIEHGIDWVCFVDIFVWFFTGQLDVRGVVVPKPFFTRCILPGTLAQVFDHPTLPTKIPMLLLQCLWAAEEVGYARVMRWGLVLVPLLRQFVWRPLLSYLFHQQLLQPKSSDSKRRQSWMMPTFEENQRRPFRGSLVY